MNQQAIDALGTQVAEIMMRGAAEFVRSRGLSAQAVDCAAICAEIRARAGKALDEALGDARQALEVRGMELLAAQTFTATFRLAGIEAARAVIEAQS